MRLSYLFALAVLVPTTALADDVNYQLETSMTSSYVFRGIVQYTGHDVPSSQNTATVAIDNVGGGTLSFVAFNATAMSHYNDQPGNELELDLSTAYTIHRGDTAITAGYTAYLFPSHTSDTPLDAAHEVSLVVAHDLPYVTPFAGAYVEFVRQQGAYVTVGVSHDYKAGRWTLSPIVSVGAAAYRKYLGTEQSASPHLNDVTASVAAKIDLVDGIYALARMSYAARLTPSDLVPMMNWGLDGRQSVFGALSLGIAR